jgi:hypothetical protein
MLYAIQIEDTVFTCCTTGQQFELATAAQSLGRVSFVRDYPRKENHANYEDYDSKETLKSYVKSVVGA